MNKPNWPFPNQSEDPHVSMPQGQAPYPAQPSQGGGRDPFQRTAEADPNQRSVYPVPGVYPALMADSLKMIQSRKGEDLFVAELEILDSQVDDRPAGTRMSWIVNYKHDSAPGNVKAFFCALMSTTEDQVTADALRYACGVQNPCQGRLVRLEASNTKTRAGGDFTLCNWQVIPENMQAQAGELRKRAGFGADIPF